MVAECLRFSFSSSSPAASRVSFASSGAGLVLSGADCAEVAGGSWAFANVGTGDAENIAASTSSAAVLIYRRRLIVHPPGLQPLPGEVRCEQSPPPAVRLRPGVWPRPVACPARARHAPL